MHDGQMLFDSSATWNRQEWGVDETLGKLLAERKVRDCIVVGIWNNSPYRHAEFFPQKALDYLDPAGRENLLGYVKGEEKIKLFPIGPCADSYLKFLVTELKSYIDSAFPTLPDRKHTVIAGSSMGGLISLYALCEYPDVFGGAACLSTHWTGTYTAEGNPVPDALAAYLNDHLPAPKGHRLYFDYGSATLDSLYKTFQQGVDVIMMEKGYSSKNWITREFPGEDHSENAWRRRLDIPLIFLLGK
jgi:enterochelin esterase-like enzyme